MIKLLKVLSLLFCIILISCEQQNLSAPVLFTQNMMTMDYRILIGKSLTKEEKLKIEKIISDTFEEIDLIYNKWNPNSEISLLNKLQKNVTATLSPQLTDFLEKVNQYVTLTEGRFDPTIESIQSLWKSSLEQNELPSKENLEQFKAIVGWNHIHIDGNKFSKDSDLVKLDLGGVVKGYCVDLLVTRLKNAGYPDVFVEWGGEIAAAGYHPEGRSWNVYVSRFEDSNPEKAVAILPLKNQAIATSGNYLQTWRVDSKIYSHIFNPITLMPIEVTPKAVASATLIAEECATADAVATALMLFNNVEEAQVWADKLIKSNPTWQIILLSR